MSKELTKDDFTIDRTKRLGDGAYAQVFLGRRNDTEEEVAVKVMDMSVCSKGSFVNIDLEISIMSQLNHRNIVNMQASWVDGSETFLVLDFCGGGELFKYMKKYDLSHMPVVAPVFVGEVVLALEYLREKGVLHRDLKPENILLTSDFHVKLADFGTACWADGGEEQKKFTGTAQYLAPEMLQPDGVQASFESDLWALGCIIYQLFCGNPPFTGATNYVIFQNILNSIDPETGENTLKYPPFVPAEAIDLISHLLQRDPADRVGSPKQGGFAEMKVHPFFRDVDWSHIHETKVTSHVDHDHSRDWAKFLMEGEEVVYASEVIKTRHLVSKKKRFLILTTYPRLFYVEDRDSYSIKDHVVWTEDLSAQHKSTREFIVSTGAGKRTYHFEDLGGHAHLWTSKINQMAQRKLKMKKK